MVTKDTVTVAPVDKYADRPDAYRTEEATVLAEGRVYAQDEIADYSDTHPTLDATGPAYDAEKTSALVTEAATVKPKKADIKAAVEALG